MWSEVWGGSSGCSGRVEVRQLEWVENLNRMFRSFTGVVLLAVAGIAPGAWWFLLGGAGCLLVMAILFLLNGPWLVAKGDELQFRNGGGAPLEACRCFRHHRVLSPRTSVRQVRSALV